MLSKKDKRAKSQDSKLSGKIIFLLLASCFFSLTANAQCAMCRAALEGEGNLTKAEAVNDGIVYLMIIPYVLVATIGVIIYKMNKKKNQ